MWKSSALNNWSALALLLALLWWAPWWLFIIVLVVTTLLLPYFYQALLATLLFDLLYTAPEAPWHYTALPLTMATLLWLWLSTILRDRLRF